jgi:hypothetical protein
MSFDESGFKESEHPRGQPGNAGQFGPGGGGSSKKEASGSSERSSGESDKEFAKRIVDKRKPPKTLPENHSDYFTMPAGTKTIPLDKLVSTKSDEENSQGAENGAKRMAAAAAGELSKRAPITVKELLDGKFEIVDGNGTYSSVKKYGWDKLPVTVEKQKPDFKGSLAKETSGDTTQPVKSVDELYERARKAEGPFKDLIESTAKKYNSTAVFTPPEHAEPGTTLKSRKSAERKLSAELGGDPKLLRDIIRATVVSEQIEDTRKAAADFIGENGDAILRVKDRYVNEITGGYRDILINYRTPEGLVAEVQFNSKNMVDAKNGSAHKLYEQVRDIQAKIKELPPGAGSKKTVEQLEQEVIQHEQQMATIYEKAYQNDGDGKGWKHQAQAHDSAAGKVIRGYRLALEGGPTFKAAIVADDGVLSVVSNRSGKWTPDDKLSYADLIMPEQALGDWDVTPVDPGELTKEIGEKLPTKRALDRSVDIEYYTSETLGPRRDRTPEGFLICYDVPVARVGEMVYGPGEVPFELGLGQDGRVRVSRSAAEVFSSQSMASLNGKPVTDDHPPVDVDPANWKFYLRGVVVNPRRGDGEQSDFLIADLIVYDNETIKDIEAGKREVSCGYNPDYLQLLDDNDAPISGRGEQVNIIYNHLALVKGGRCGPACAIGDRKTVDALNASAFWSLERAARLRRLADRL